MFPLVRRTVTASLSIPAACTSPVSPRTVSGPLSSVSCTSPVPVVSVSPPRRPCTAASPESSSSRTAKSRGTSIA